MLVECENCGKEFNKSRRDIKRTNHNFCCISCFTEYRVKNRSIGCKNKQLKKLVNMSKLRQKYINGEIDKETLSRKFAKML